MKIRIRVYGLREFVRAAQILKYSSTKDTKNPDIFILNLRAPRVLRGKKFPVFFGCGSTVMDLPEVDDPGWPGIKAKNTFEQR
jgi:hypothetical protein